jgi:hypothetical protein
VRPVLEEMEEETVLEASPQGEAPAQAPAGRPQFKMSPGTARRPFGGRAISKENMDVPAFMRKQMD